LCSAHVGEQQTESVKIVSSLADLFSAPDLQMYEAQVFMQQFAPVMVILPDWDGSGTEPAKHLFALPQEVHVSMQQLS
jgi:hypothetical protein